MSQVMNFILEQYQRAKYCHSTNWKNTAESLENNSKAKLWCEFPGLADHYWFNYVLYECYVRHWYLKWYYDFESVFA